MSKRHPPCDQSVARVAVGVRWVGVEKLQDHGIRLGAEVFMPEGTGRDALRAAALKR